MQKEKEPVILVAKVNGNLKKYLDLMELERELNSQMTTKTLFTGQPGISLVKQLHYNK